MSAAAPCPKELNPELQERLRALRRALGRPLKITSGIRCPKHNARVGGTPTSEHLTGHGVDISADTAQARFEIVKHAFALGFTRVGIARTFVHLGISRTHPQNVIWLY